MQKSVKIFSNTNFNLSISDRHGSRVKNYTYIYLINIYCTLKYISLIYIYIYIYEIFEGVSLLHEALSKNR